MLKQVNGNEKTLTAHINKINHLIIEVVFLFIIKWYGLNYAIYSILKEKLTYEVNYMGYVEFNQKDSSRHIERMMSILKDHAERVLPAEELRAWEAETRQNLRKHPEHAEEALLTLRIMEQIHQGSSIYDAMMFTARADCSDTVNKYGAMYDAIIKLGHDEAQTQSLVAEMYNTLDVIDDYRYNHRAEFRIRPHANDFPRELFDRYDAHQTGIEYKPVEPSVTPADLKARGESLVRPDVLADWGEYVDNAFKNGPTAIATAVSTLDILEAYQAGTRLQDLQDMLSLTMYMRPSDPSQLEDNLFRMYQGDGFGTINLQDKMYLIGLKGREPEMSVPQAHKACMERAESILPAEKIDEFSKNIDGALAWGADMSKQVLAGLDYIEAIRNGVPLEEVKQNFEADKRFGGDMQISVAKFVERFTEIKGLRDYLDKDGPMPVVAHKGPTFTGPEGPEDNNGHNDYDGPVGLGQ